MTTAPKDMLVLKNEAGEYFVLPQELLERGRIPAEHTAEVERLIAAGNADDVAGHLNFAKIEFRGQFAGTAVGAIFSISPLVHDRRDQA